MKLVYLDPDFVAARYELETKVSASAQFTKGQGGNAEAGISFFKAGVHTQESVTYSKSSTAMLREIQPVLEKVYPSIDVGAFANGNGTQTAWIQGDLTIQSWQPQGASTGFDYYAIVAAGGNLALLAEAAYFASGFGLALQASPALLGNISIPVRALVRILWNVQMTQERVGVPLVVFEPD